MKKKVDYSKPHKIGQTLEKRMLEESKGVMEVVKTVDKNGKVKVKYVPMHPEFYTEMKIETLDENGKVEKVEYVPLDKIEK